MGWSVNRPTGLTYHRTGLSTKGYTLLTPSAGPSTFLLDMAGRVVHRWDFDDMRPSYGRLLSSGNLLMRGTDRSIPRPAPHDPTKPPPPVEQRVRGLGGNSTQLREVDWDGKTVWEHRDEFAHHDFVRLANGNTLYPAWVELPEDLQKRVRGGRRRPREKLPRMLGDDIVEIDPAGDEVRRIHTWKLLDPRADPIGPLEGRWEWTHLNGIDVNDAGDIVFSCRHNSRVGIIDGGTGELRWKYTRAHWQHHPTFVAEGNVQIFDNGRAGSRVLEVDPKTDEVVWSYEGSPAPQFFSAHISGASRLPTQAVLVCEGGSGRVFEVTRDREVVWEWINPFVNTGPTGKLTVSLFRAHRYLPDHPALRERSLDPARHADLNRLHGLGPL